ncbi:MULTISPECIES: hypothetical protein [unclassified Bacillus (in: firmicutes)]|uniref:hypothetical protein n=1 Tax=unclassified Bacillus (in: firmicutes) TaxID=185979 RepID=UPI00163D14FF|nr:MULTISPECIES: hypothetical protein [unclassified Bacillus (in: firmicutes)]QNH48706.1 hypothetical protein H7F25_04325 [Bacillus sp. PAMC28571]QNK43001.1 hypothetical protein H7F24_10890 [Bacillus sp. PAMC22265]
MREIKTEAQTLDLSKKVTVEVSLAELIVISAALLEADNDVVNDNVQTYSPYARYSNQILGELPNTHDLMANVDDIAADHIPKEDE